MLTGITFFLTVLLALILLVIYRRDLAVFSRSREAKATEKLCAQLEATADAILAQIDQRVDKLEKLLAQADALTRQTEDRAESRNGYFSLPDQRAAAMPKVTAVMDKQQEIRRLRQAGLSDQDIAQLTGIGLGEIHLISRLYKT